MAMCPSSARSVLRKLVRRSGPDILSSISSLRGCLGQQFDKKAPHWASSNLLDSRHLTACSQSLPFHVGREDEEEEFLSIGRACSPSGLDLVTSTRAAKAMNYRWSKETSDFKLSEQRWSHLSRYASSSFMLHPMIMMPYRGLASGGTKDDATIDVTPTTPLGGGNADQSVKEWVETAYNGIVESSKTVRDSVDVIIPPIKRVLEDHPIILQLSITLSIVTGAWVIMPGVLRRIHAYVEAGSAALLQDKLRGSPEELKELQKVPYELSAWKAMEAPARLFATLLTMLQVGVLVSPNVAVAEYLTQFWSGGSILCGVWFLHRWKRIVVFERLPAWRNVTKEERARVLEFDKFSTWALMVLGAFGVAKAAGVPVSSLLTVGGIGGIATAFAAREILANLLTGVTLTFSKPFTVGDVIKAGTVEGKVEEVGMITTRLLNFDKYPITVPNAFFTSQAIINKSRAPCRFLTVKIPIRLQDFEIVPRITMEIREMLYRNPEVYLEEEKPSCHIAQMSASALEIAIACNIKQMSKNDYVLVEQRILVDAARIITTSGASLGGP